MTKYFGANRENWPARMTIARAWKRIDQGGLEDLREWCKSVTKPTLIMIDTLKRVRPPKKANQSDYDADYEACQGLLDLCREFAGLGIIVAHHDRKMDAEDVFDTVSGTLGLTGGVDTIAILKRSGVGVTLHIQGRDLIDDVEKAVRFDRETCRWVILGEAAEVHKSDERKRVTAALSNAINGLSIEDIVASARLTSNGAARKLLSDMVQDGTVSRPRRGIYCLPQYEANVTARARPVTNAGNKPDPKESPAVQQKQSVDDAISSNVTLVTGGTGSPEAIASISPEATAPTSSALPPGNNGNKPS
jgi:hypothetical protein